MKKYLLLAPVLVTIILLINTATAIPYTQSKALEESKINYNSIPKIGFSSIGKLKGLIYVLIGFFGIAEAALIVILAYAFAGVFDMGRLGLVFIVLGVIIGIPSVAFLVAGTVLIFQ